MSKVFKEDHQQSHLLLERFNMSTSPAAEIITDDVNDVLREKFIEWCKNTSNHGFSKIVSTRSRFLRIAWSLCFLASLAYCSYVITKSLVDYYKCKTTVSIYHHQDKQTILPAITICNMNAYNIDLVGEYYRHHPIGTTQSDECIKKAKNWQTCFSPNETYLIHYYMRSFKGLIANDENLISNRTLYSFSLKNDMLVRCLYDLKPCFAENFTLQWSNTLGNCYTMGRNPVLKASGTGSFLGLILEMVVSPYSIKTTYNDKAGLILIIHNQTDQPYASITQNYGINIPAGYETYIGITRKITKKLGSPYSDCIRDLTPFSSDSERIFGYFRDLNESSYSQDFCSALCYQDKVKGKCNCTDISSPAIRNSTYCTSPKQLDCLFRYFISFTSSPENDMCKSTCRKKCFNIEFEIEKNMIGFPNENYLRYVQSSDKLNRFPPNEPELSAFAKRSYLKLSVNYKSLEYTVIEENPQMTFEILLGNIGGQLGLFIGMSVLSLIEIVELLTEIFVVIFKHRIKSAKK